MTNRLRQPRSIATIALVLCIILSITVVSPFLSNATNHKRALATISESKANATALSLTVTLASTAISLLPDDTGSAIADELSELSTPLLIVVCILFFDNIFLPRWNLWPFQFCCRSHVFFSSPTCTWNAKA